MDMGGDRANPLVNSCLLIWAGGNGSAVKSVYRYCGGPEFSSQHTRKTTYNCLQLHLHKTHPSTAHTWGVRLKAFRTPGPWGCQY